MLDRLRNELLYLHLAASAPPVFLQIMVKKWALSPSFFSISLSEKKMTLTAQVCLKWIALTPSTCAHACLHACARSSLPDHVLSSSRSEIIWNRRFFKLPCSWFGPRGRMREQHRGLSCHKSTSHLPSRSDPNSQLAPTQTLVLLPIKFVSYPPGWTVRTSKHHVSLWFGSQYEWPSLWNLISGPGVGRLVLPLRWQPRDCSSFSPDL